MQSDWEDTDDTRLVSPEELPAMKHFLKTWRTALARTYGAAPGLMIMVKRVQEPTDVWGRIDGLHHVLKFCLEHPVFEPVVGFEFSVIGADTRRCMRRWRDRTSHGQFLLCYDNGKSAVRVLPGVRCRSVHKFALPTAPGSGSGAGAGTAASGQRVRAGEAPWLLRRPQAEAGAAGHLRQRPLHDARQMRQRLRQPHRQLLRTRLGWPRGGAHGDAVLLRGQRAAARAPARGQQVRRGVHGAKATRA